MKRFIPAVPALAACLLLASCSKSDSDATPADQGGVSNPNADPLASSEAVPVAPDSAAASNDQARAVVEAAEAVLGEQARNLMPQSPGVAMTGSNAPMATRVLDEVAKGAGGDWGGLLKSLATENADPLLNSLGGDLGQVATQLQQSFQSDEGLAASVETALKALSEGRDTEALGLHAKLTKAGLTPQQQELAAEVRNLTAAFLAEKRLSALDGAEGQVATVVNALRQGEVATVLPAIKEIASNASLTPEQKGLLKSLAQEYAPGLSALGKSLPAGLPALPPMPGQEN
jgi:hypothetical protein